MYLKKLYLVNFKNFSEEDIQFSSKINCFVGNNGVGKTNLLDAIYYLSFCKSYFNAVDSQNIKHGEKFLVIQGIYDLKDREEEIYCGIKKGQKKIFKKNKKEYGKLSEHIGLLPLVMVSPNDTELITGGSDIRRKYMNGVISQYDKSYLDSAIKYNKVLEQRNAMLKNMQGSAADTGLFEAFDAQLVRYGEYIYKKRLDFFEQLLPVFQKYYSGISGNREKVNLRYSSQLNEQSFPELLKNSFNKDRILEYTTVGIHKDDLDFELEEFPIKKTGSQGQQKTYLLALKLAQFDFIKEINGFNPIILLDDIFDKLDMKRVEEIIKLLSDHHFGQVFISDTNADRLNKILSGIDIEHKNYDISDGKIMPFKLNQMP